MAVRDPLSIHLHLTCVTWVVPLLLLFTACSAKKDRPRAAYVPVAELETEFGPLIAAGNHPTHDQNGTGDRLGVFRDSRGTIWGLPLTVSASGSVLGCAPPALQHAPVTDTYPADTTLVGVTNEP